MKKLGVDVLIGLAVLMVLCAGRAPEDMTREEKNKLLVKVAIGAFNVGDFEALKELYSPQFVQHQPGNKKTISWEGFELACRIVRSTIPTWRFEIEDIIAEGDKVAVRLKTVITYKPKSGYGTWLTGKIELTELDLYRIEDGRIVEEWCEHDTREQTKELEKLKQVKSWR